MGRMFQANIDEPAATTQRDLLELVAPSGSSIVIHRVVLTTSIETDANEVQDKLDVFRYVGGFTAGATSIETPAAFALGTTGATEDATTVTHGATTQTTGGTAEALATIYMNNRLGWEYLPTPEERVTIAPTDAFTIQMTAVFAASTGVAGYVVFEEIVA